MPKCGLWIQHVLAKEQTVFGCSFSIEMQIAMLGQAKCYLTLHSAAAMVGQMPQWSSQSASSSACPQHFEFRGVYFFWIRSFHLAIVPNSHDKTKDSPPPRRTWEESYSMWRGSKPSFETASPLLRFITCFFICWLKAGSLYVSIPIVVRLLYISV